MVEPLPNQATSSAGPPPPRPGFDDNILDSWTGPLSDEEMRNFAVHMALTGHSLEQGLRHLERTKDIKIEALEEECRSRKEVLRKWIGQINDSIQNHKQTIQRLWESQTSLRQTRFSIGLSIQMLQLKKATIRLNMRVKQLEKEREFFTDESQKLTEKHEQIKQESLRGKETELEYAKRLHTSLLDIWKTDEEELRRRAEVFGKEESRIHTSLQEVEERIKHLRAVGISRTTAGFLIWVGYTAFAGVGSVVGAMMQRRQGDPKGADFFGNFIRGFASAFGLEQGKSFLWSPFLKLIGFVLIVLIVLALVTSLWDWILRTFQPRWGKGNEARGTGKRPTRPNHQRQNLLSLFTAGSDRLSLFTGKINRSDYVQLLAIAPYLVLASIIVFLISALGLAQPLSGSTPGTVPTTLTTASIGAIFTLLSTSVCLLYATKVIEPRWNRLLREDQSNVSSWRYLRANWEFALVLLSMIAAILILTFFPIDEHYNYQAWGLTALFMILGSIGLAYGLLYRGIFKDFDVLSRSRQEYLIKIQEFILKPTLGDVFESTEPEELKESADKYRKAIEYLDGLRIGSELNDLFGSSRPEYDSGFFKLWFQDLSEDEPANEPLLRLPRLSVRKLRRLIRRLGNPPPVMDESSLASWKVAPEEREEFNAHEEQIEMYTRRLDDIDKEVVRVDAEKAMAESTLSTTVLELKDYETRLWTAETDCSRKLREHNLQKQHDEVNFTSAFLTGRIVYDFLGESPGVKRRQE